MKTDERNELLGRLIDTVEDFLTERGVDASAWSNPERDSDDDPNAALICGSDYDALAKEFATALGLDNAEDSPKGKEKNGKKFPVVAVQHSPEDYLSRKTLKYMENLFDGDTVEFMTVEGDNAIATVMVNGTIMESWSDDALDDVRGYIRKILDDIDLEHADGVYWFKDIEFYLGYENWADADDRQFDAPDKAASEFAIVKDTDNDFVLVSTAFFAVNGENAKIAVYLTDNEEDEENITAYVLAVPETWSPAARLDAAYVVGMEDAAELVPLSDLIVCGPKPALFTVTTTEIGSWQNMKAFKQAAGFVKELLANVKPFAPLDIAFTENGEEAWNEILGIRSET